MGYKILQTMASTAGKFFLFILYLIFHFFLRLCLYLYLYLHLFLFISGAGLCSSAFASILRVEGLIFIILFLLVAVPVLLLLYYFDLGIYALVAILAVAILRLGE